MSGPNESVNNVTAELRGYAHGMPPYSRETMQFKTLLSYLDRIDAAANRDMKRAIIKIKGPGSMFCQAKRCPLRKLAEFGAEGA